MSEVESPSIIKEVTPSPKKLLREMDEEKKHLQTPPSARLAQFVFYLKQWLGISDSNYVAGTEQYCRCISGGVMVR